MHTHIHANTRAHTNKKQRAHANRLQARTDSRIKKSEWEGGRELISKKWAYTLPVPLPVAGCFRGRVWMREEGACELNVGYGAVMMMKEQVAIMFLFFIYLA